MLMTLLRTLIMYIVVVGALRMMGKRQIGELEASELVVTIIISDIAAMPITNMGVPLITNIIAILTLMLLEIFISFGAFKSPKMRSIMYGKPSTFFKNGKFNQKEMLRQRFNVADIMEEIRGNGVCSLSDVEYIVMETNGKVSVILKQSASAVTPEQLKIETEPARLSYIIVDNGLPIRSSMKQLGLTEQWLQKQIKEKGLKNVNDIFYLSFEADTGKTVLIPREEKR